MRHARAMARRPMAEIPVDLRARLEEARLDLLALFRALDQMDLSPAEIPQRISVTCRAKPSAIPTWVEKKIQSAVRSAGSQSTAP